MYQVLLVEDDEKIREVIQDYVSDKGKTSVTLFTAKNGKECRELLGQRQYDLLLLDVMLPDTDGFEICRTVREKSNVPIIFLTARGSLEDILWGYGLGCDDYVVKPFSLAELFAKMLAVIKRYRGNTPGTPEDVLTIGDIRLDKRACKVYVQDVEVELQNKQYAILRFLIENPGRVFSRDQLLDRLWGYDYEGVDRVVDNQVKLLRKALGSAGKQIKTVIGQGYRIGDE